MENANRLVAGAMAVLVSGAVLTACGDKPQPGAAAEPAKSIGKAPVAQTQAEAPKVDLNALLASRVKAALAGDPDLKSLAIDVTAKDGIVTLHGTASTKARRDRAGKLVAGVDGVKSVDNGLVILAGS